MKKDKYNDWAVESGLKIAYYRNLSCENGEVHALGGKQASLFGVRFFYRKTP